MATTAWRCVSPDLISRVFDAVFEEVRDWQNRPLGGPYAPAVTAEAREIARLVETKRPALVLLDLALPGTDGIALMQTLPALAKPDTALLNQSYVPLVIGQDVIETILTNSSLPVAILHQPLSAGRPQHADSDP